ncbi:MAG: thioredoxin domain-containing protein, partial [Hydrogenophaga sp.]|nr:thioredoxin domain-containing protein [Hydrogenophaga sp.]
MRLARDFGAAWVDETTVAAWSAGGGDRVVLLAGDPVRFPEGQDVAAVLPELMKSFANRFQIAVVPRDNEDAVARRYGSQRWPTLLFFRDGQYVTAIAGQLVQHGMAAFPPREFREALESLRYDH